MKPILLILLILTWFNVAANGARVAAHGDIYALWVAIINAGAVFLVLWLETRLEKKKSYSANSEERVNGHTK